MRTPQVSDSRSSYNTSAYDSLDSLRLMEGVVKRATTPTSPGRPSREMYRQVGDLVLRRRLARRGLILRHLIMPGLLDETEAILRCSGLAST